MPGVIVPRCNHTSKMRDVGHPRLPSQIETWATRHVMAIGSTAAKMVPLLGIFVSAAATATDLHKMGNDFDACMAVH
jgi:hypothetical protein